MALCSPGGTDQTVTKGLRLLRAHLHAPVLFHSQKPVGASVMVTGCGALLPGALQTMCVRPSVSILPDFPMSLLWSQGQKHPELKTELHFAQKQTFWAQFLHITFFKRAALL